MKRPAGSYPGLCLIQAGGDRPCVVLPFRLRQPFAIIARESPGVHAGMCDDKDRRKNADKLRPALESLLYDAPRRQAMATAARKLGRPDAAMQVAHVVIGMTGISR